MKNLAALVVFALIVWFTGGGNQVTAAPPDADVDDLAVPDQTSENAERGTAEAGGNANAQSDPPDTGRDTSEPNENDVPAGSAGQGALDRATELKITADSMEDLTEVIALSETALDKGLDKENAQFARQLLTSTLFQRATAFCQPIFEREPPSPAWPRFRTMAMADLEKALKIEPKLGNAHLLLARLHLLPGGERKTAESSVNHAVELLATGDFDNELSKALTLRAMLSDDADKQLADLNQAIRLDPNHQDAFRVRGTVHMLRKELKAAIADFDEALRLDEDDEAATLAKVECLMLQDELEEAMKLIDQAVVDFPSSEVFTLRAQALARQSQLDKAEEALNDAIELDPRSLSALLLRARLRFSQKKLELARGDVDRVLSLRPGLPPALVLSSIMFSAQGKHDQAIKVLRKLVQQSPDSVEYRTQLANAYLAADRPRRAIDVFNSLLKNDGDDWQARRGRADAYLALGKHAEAIADYEAAMRQKEGGENPTILNNFAWVLATSPVDDLRQGQRAIKLATKACEITEFKEAHILSTLAAAYAEAGDFQTAMRWSVKAVEMSDDDVQQQLREELESYRQNKPWRELKQPPTENDAPEPPDFGDLELEE